jgi:hypothetical protein
MTDDAGTDRTGGEDRSRAGRREQMQRIDALEQRVDDVARALDGLEGLLQHLLLTASTPAAPTDPPAADPDTADPHTAAPHTADPDAAAPPAGRNDQDDRDDPTDPDGPGGRNGAGGLDMRALVAWVRDNIALLIERKMPQSGGWPHWCPMWWLHPEAIARFEALRRAWLDATTHTGGTGLVVYFEHVDLQLATLCGDNGPFSGCLGRHNPAGPAHRLGQFEPDEAYYREVQAATASDTRPTPPPAPPPRPAAAPPPHPATPSGGGYARPGSISGARLAPLNGTRRNGYGAPPQHR